MRGEVYGMECCTHEYAYVMHHCLSHMWATPFWLSGWSQTHSCDAIRCKLHVWALVCCPSQTACTEPSCVALHKLCAHVYQQFMYRLERTYSWQRCIMELHHLVYCMRSGGNTRLSSAVQSALVS